MPHDGRAMKYHDTLLTLANGLFLLAVVYEVKRDHTDSSSSPPPYASGSALVIIFYIFITISLAGVLANVYHLFNSYFRITNDDDGDKKNKIIGPGQSVVASALSPWLRSHVYVMLYVTNELIFKALLMSNHATVWEIPNAPGRMRLVYPLRYISWASTNSYIFTAVAIAFGLRTDETFAACLSIIFCTLASFPLELLPAYSLLWFFSAIVALFALFTCLTLVVSRAAVLFPLASRFEALALAAILFTTGLTLLAFPLVYFTAVLCGGDGKDSCLTNAEEANTWFMIEGLGKFFFYLLVVAASIISASCVAAYKLSSMLVQRPVLIHNLPPKLKAVAKERRSTWTEVLNANIGVLVGAPVFTGFFVFIVQASIFSSPSLKFASADVMTLVMSIKRASGAITVLAVASVFFLGLDRVLYLENLRTLVSTFMPAVYRNGDEESDWDFGSGAFVAPKVFYIEEPHVTVLFCDIVDFTPASLDTVPTEMMMTLGSLFGHFDQLLAAVAGVIKVGTAGDAYLSVMGATSPDDIIPDAATQAATMASLALSLIEAAREHKWPNTGAPILVRVGLHCGPVTSGILGGTLPRWGIFGKTVVIAARMESTGKPSCVQVSSAFAASLREGESAARSFELTAREVNVKGVGSMHTFILCGRIGEHKKKHNE